MFSIESIITVAIAVVSGYIAFVERRIALMQKKIDSKISRQELSDFVDLKQEKIEVMLQELKEDVKEIKDELKKK